MSSYVASTTGSSKASAVSRQAQAQGLWRRRRMLSSRAGASRRSVLVAGGERKRDKCSSRSTSGSTSHLPERLVQRKKDASRGLEGASHVTNAAFDPGALSSACSTTFKLVLLCGVISRLMKIQMLPKDTPVILSKVAFNVLLPCLLCSKVAITLIKLGDPAMLGIPILGLLQIGVGLAAGALLHKVTEMFLVEKEVKKPAMAVAVGTSNGADMDSATVPYQKQQDERTRKTMKSIVKAACAFGNSVTLPLIFFSTLLSGAQYDLAAGYTALFLIAWSPALWSLGYSMFVGTEETVKVEDDSDKSMVQKMTGAIGGFLVQLKSYINP